MNEITRIHIAKTAYDIEIAAKKQLEKYIKSLETYTQDKEVLEDIEIRITELLAEQGVAAGAVISSDDVRAIRKQLGEPYEFANDEGDIAIGATTDTSRRLYRSTDNAVLGGVLSGIAAYFGVNPLWTRLIFLLVLLISFGTATFAYILLWILISPARTATEKLQLAGKDVTLESIKELNADEEHAQPNRVAPALQRTFSVIFGSVSALGALLAFGLALWMIIATLTNSTGFVDVANGFMGLGDGSTWLAWLLFWIVVFGVSLFAVLCGLIAYAFFAKKLTKTMIISGIAIIVLGVASVATVVGVGSTQSLRVASESRSLVRETKANLPREFTDVNSVKISLKSIKTGEKTSDFLPQYSSIVYEVDPGNPRYELSGLPATKVATVVNGKNAEIVLEVPNSYRNTFVQPVLTIYGPALETLDLNGQNDGTQFNYNGTTQAQLTTQTTDTTNLTVTGSYEKVSVKGSGNVHLGTATVGSLDVQARQFLRVTAGTVRELTVTQPDVCPFGAYSSETSVVVSGVSSGSVLYNGKAIPVADYETSCGSLSIAKDYKGYRD